MKSLVEILTEGSIGDLKNIKKIRHYTTLRGLTSILDDGYIKAQESEGDAQWDYRGYDDVELGTNKKVVSFLDARYDNEKGFLEKANRENDRMQDSWVLGLHIDEICAYIEYDFDKIPQNILDKAVFIKYLENAVPGYTDAWNYMIETIEEFNLRKTIKTREDFEKFIHQDGLINYGAAWNWHDAYQYVDADDEVQEIIDVIRKRKLKSYSEADTKALLDACIVDDKKAVLSILKAHGWKKGDDQNYYILEMLPKTDTMFGTIDNCNFLDYINTKYFKSDKKYIIPGEIRIACDIPLNIPGCTIHFFRNTASCIAYRLEDHTLLTQVEVRLPFAKCKVKIHD